jgi:predicted GNAT superfamily acetyltransferase
MELAADETPLARDAAGTARAAARAAGVQIDVLSSIEDMGSIESLLRRVWDDDRPQISAHLLRALATEGSYVAGASRDRELVGASMAFLAGRPADIHLHSHISGIAPGLQGRGLGYALKQHQRWWALTRGIPLVTWTFDPLVRRNAYFNLTKLGAEIIDFMPNFYGAMTDGINKEDESDRCHVAWTLGSARAIEAAAGRNLEADDRADAFVILEEGSDGAPVVHRARGEPIAATIPQDIVALRRSDPGLARRWRIALRETFEAAFDAGFTATSMSKAGTYLLERRR